MKRARRDRIIELFLVFCISLGFATLNLYHVFYWFFHKPPGSIFIGISHWYQDYFYYLSQLTQGILGDWTLSNKYTTELIPQGISWWFNLGLGKINAIVPIPVWLFYDASIYCLSVIYIILIYIILCSLYPKNSSHRIGSLLIALASTNMYTLTGSSIHLISYFYAYTSSLNRLGGIAHHVGQNILSLGFILVISKIFSEWKNMKSLVRLTIMGSLILIFLFIISAFYVAVDIVVFALCVVLYLFVYRNTRYLFRLFFSVLVMILPIIPLAFYQSKALQHPFWIFVRDWEAMVTPTNVHTFLLSSGFIVLFVFIGIFPFLKKWTPLRVVGFVFAFLPILLYFSPLPRLFHMPSFRLLQPPAYVFLGAMAIEGIYVVSLVAGRYKRFLFSLILGAYLAVQIPAIATEVQTRTGEYFLNSPLNFVPIDVFEGLNYLRTLPRSSHVLAFHTLETLIPVMSGHTVYTGHGTLTINYNEKTLQTMNFFAGSLNQHQAYDMLTNNSIGYIVWRTTDGNSAVFTDTYPFLKKIWENSLIQIYAVE